MEIDEAIKHLEFSKKSYQNLIDNDTRNGEVIGKDTTGTWKTNTSLATVYQTMRDTMVVAIRSLEAWEKVKAEIDQYLFQNEFGLEYRKEVSQIIDKYKAESEENNGNG